MIIAIEIVGALLSAALLFLPVTTLPYLIVQGEMESGVVLAYCIAAVVTSALVALARRNASLPAAWSNVFTYLLLSLGISVASSIASFAFASLGNVVDSSHGGSIAIVVFTSLGIGFGASVVLAERVRRAL